MGRILLPPFAIVVSDHTLSLRKRGRQHQRRVADGCLLAGGDALAISRFDPVTGGASVRSTTRPTTRAVGSAIMSHEFRLRPHKPNGRAVRDHVGCGAPGPALIRRGETVAEPAKKPQAEAAAGIARF